MPKPNADVFGAYVDDLLDVSTRRRSAGEVRPQARPSGAPGGCPCPWTVASGPSEESPEEASNARNSACAPRSAGASATSARATVSTSARTLSAPRSTASFGPSCSPAHRSVRRVSISIPGATALSTGTPRAIRWISSRGKGWIHWYKGHAVRRNVAASHADDVFASRRLRDDIWKLTFELADRPRGPPSRAAWFRTGSRLETTEWSSMCRSCCTRSRSW